MIRLLRAEEITNITFVIEETVLRQYEPSLSPELQPLTSLFVQPALESDWSRV